MRKHLFVLILILVFFSPAFAQETSDETTEIPNSSLIPSETPTQVRDEFNNYDIAWFDFYSAFQEGNRKKALELLENLYEAKLNLGDKNVTPYSYALVTLSGTVEGEGDLETAKSLIEQALRLSPDTPRVYFYYTAFLWRNEPSDIFRLIDLTYTGILKSFSDVTIFSTLIANFLISLIITLLSLFALFALTLCVKYIPLLSNDIKELFRWEAPVWLYMIFLVVFIIFIASLNLGIIWMIVILNLLFCFYYSKPERILAAVFYVILIFSSPILTNTATMMLSTHREVLDEITQIRDDIYTWTAENNLKAWVEEHPDDTYALFTLGLLNKKTGYLDYARDYYASTIDNDPSLSIALNNTGNINFILADYNTAREFYNAAINNNPSLASSYYNLYKIDILTLNLDSLEESSKNYETALSLDQKRVSRFTEIAIKEASPDFFSLVNINRLVIDEDIPNSIIWGRMYSTSEPREMANDLWKDAFTGVGLKAAPLIAFIILPLFIALGTLQERYSFSKSCKYCGKPFTIKTASFKDRRDSCNRCFAVFVRREGVDPKTKADLRRKVDKSNMIRKTLVKGINILIPGSGNIYLGNPIKGFIFYVLWIFFVVQLITLSGVMVYPLKVIGFPFIHNLYPYAIALGLIYIIAQRDFFKSESSLL